MQPVYTAACLYSSESVSRGLSAGVQPVYQVSEPTYREMSARVKHIYTVSKPTSRGLFVRGTSIFIWFPNLPTWNCSLAVQLVHTVSEPRGHCLLELQPVFTLSEPTFRRLLARCAAVYTVLERTTRDLSTCGAACS